MSKIRVWDLPLRLFHWALATLVIAAIVAVKIGGNAMVWHFRCGYAVLALLAFRLIWGVLGSRYARFSSLVLAPSRIIAYLKNRKAGGKPAYTGHNPLGGLSVLAMLLVLLAQVMSGLFANDDIDSEGPLVKFISKQLSDRISDFHADINSYLIYVLIGLHLLAIIYYQFVKKENLVTPMITGDKIGEPQDAASGDSWQRRLLALALLAACAAVVYYIVTL